ncbi:hypothetical protein SUGI_0657090 [Cryptomeria japonica]|uniref:glutathione gamma-glutamylcysteinyltransferase 1 isoform X1 n=2 Tax=Cryptomeria japonica TaxID=3369 RepID=UPI00241475B1|nr:glutathione gamma-glutamylcysteinyltransferase 1 isoform X1 [Cryptomeria japonica]GLJ32658.1 hypothetical protein SUGI_0657090 [Cryptomeria japonica]
MAVAGLYKRRLPCPPAVDFSSSEGKALFREALQSGTMEGFFKLISYFQTQSEPAYCGLASLSVVLNALAIDPGRKWKGPWRWFDESMLDCCEPLDKVKIDGISFGKVACLANCSGANVEAFRTNQSSLNDFRKLVAKCASSDDCHLIASYHRGTFKQTGSGHFSPIGGYHCEKDMALILDVARFKYPPHWVPIPLLWEAMNTIDESTQHHRGFMLISKREQAPSLLYTLSCKHESWKGISKYFMEEVPQLLKSEDIINVQKVMSAIFVSLPAKLTDFIKWIAEVRRWENKEKMLDKEEADRLAIKAEILQQLRTTDIYKVVDDWSSSTTSCCRLSWSFEDNLSEIANHVCCQGASTINGNVGTANECLCRQYCIRNISTDDMSAAIVSGTVVANGTEQGVDVLIPSTAQLKHPPCCMNGENSLKQPPHCMNGENSPTNWLQTYPASKDLLTILLLALPRDTWQEIQKKELREEIYHLISTNNLSNGLKEEVLHLQRQLHLLYRCQNGTIEEDV